MSVALAPSASNKPRYDTAEVALFDPVATNRSATRGALASLGFRRVQTPYDVPSLVQRLKGQNFDLVVVEVRPDPRPVLSLIQDVRQGRVGLNPFTIIVATAWTLDDDIVRKVMQSGADDLLGRPFSIGFMGQRIKQLVDARKGFVVTADYIGPDRRRDAARGTGAPLIQAPNSLKLKAACGLDSMAAETAAAAQIAKSREDVNLAKSRRNAFTIVIQAKLIQAALEGSTPTSTLQADLQKIEDLAAETVRRTEASPFSMSFQMCEPIIQAAKAAMRGEEIAHHLSLIGQLGTTLYATLTPGRSTDEIDFEVTQAMFAIQSRAQRA
jgi:CheY-like chemotaxis protein